MEKTISNTLRTIFLVHMIISLILGAALWLVPGRTLTVLGWVKETVEFTELGVSAPGTIFVDGVLTRLLGAAMLALAYSSFRGWRAERWEQVALVVQLEFIFCATALVGALAGFYNRNSVPLIGWVIAVVLAVFTLLWGWALRR
jgi:hypothetical protein